MVWGKINASSQHILSTNTVFKRQDVTLECGSFFFQGERMVSIRADSNQWDGDSIENGESWPSERTIKSEKPQCYTQLVLKSS